jgi:hypothetical protein
MTTSEMRAAQTKPDPDGNFVEQSRNIANDICRHLKLDLKWPEPKFEWLRGRIQEALFTYREILSKRLATPSVASPQAWGWCGELTPVASPQEPPTSTSITTHRKIQWFCQFCQQNHVAYCPVVSEENFLHLCDDCGQSYKGNEHECPERGASVSPNLPAPHINEQQSGEHRADSKQTSAAPVGESGRTPPNIKENEIPEPFCCFVGEKGHCGLKAEWIVVHGSSLDELTHSCTAHVGGLLTDSKIHYIYPIECELAAPPAQGAPGTREAQPGNLIDKYVACDCQFDQGHEPHCAVVKARNQRELLQAAEAVIEWEDDYRKLNNLGKYPPHAFIRLATAVAALAQPGAPTKEGAQAK